jgi:ribosomal protein L17
MQVLDWQDFLIDVVDGKKCVKGLEKYFENCKCGNKLNLKQRKVFLTMLGEVVPESVLQEKEIVKKTGFPCGTVKTYRTSIYNNFGMSEKGARHKASKLLEKLSNGYQEAKNRKEYELPDSTDIGKWESSSRRNAKDNLPNLNHNQFFDRQNELSKLLHYLSPDNNASIITLSGIGGVGKTALVLEAAYRCLGIKRNEDRQNINEHIPDFDIILFTSAKEESLNANGVIKNLSSSRTLQEIFRDIADFFDDQSILHGDRKFTEQKIYNYFKDKRVMLIIDNFETVESEGDIIGFLERLPYGSKSVITTRVTHRGTYQILLPGLTKSEGIALIDEQLRSSTCLDETQKKRIIQNKNAIFDATGGVPLAIIYAVGILSNGMRIKFVIENIQSPDEKIAEFFFKKSIDQMKNNNRSISAYRLIMAASIFHTSPNKKSLFYVAGINDRAEAESALMDLSCRSFIYQHERLLKMLPLTKVYAKFELDKNSSFKSECRERWVSWYLGFAENNCSKKRDSSRRTSLYSKMHEEWSDILAVLRWCKDKGRYKDVKKLWFLVNNYANLRGEWKQRKFWLEWIINESNKEGNFPDNASASMYLARTLLLEGTTDSLRQAEDFLNDAWSLKNHLTFRQKDYISNHMVGLYIRLEQYEKAEEWLALEQANLDSCDFSDDKKILYVIFIEREKADLFFHQKKYSESKKACNTVIENAKKIDPLNIRSINYAKRILAEIAMIEEDLPLAKRYLEEGFREVRENFDKRRVGYYRTSFSRLYIKLAISTHGKSRYNYLQEARTNANEAKSRFLELGMKRNAEKINKLHEEINKLFQSEKLPT